MTVYISGGSNSLRSIGWVSFLRDRIGDTERVENLSIGAAPSHMGAFRCHQIPDLGPDDTVIWEYGINDANHIDRRGFPPQEVLKAIEWIILLCRDRGAKFAAMIFQTRNREAKKKVTRYRRRLHSLCDRYGVGYFDVPSEYLSGNPSADRIPPEYFDDNLHYKVDTELMDLIADGAMSLLNSARVPNGEPRRDIGRLAIYTEFDGGVQDFFENRMVSVRTWRPGEQKLACRLDAPGRVIGVILTATSKGGVLDLTLGSRTLRFSASYRERNFNKTMLKFVSLPVLSGDDLAFGAGEEISIDWAGSVEGILGSEKRKRPIGADALEAREAGIVALMVEEF